MHVLGHFFLLEISTKTHRTAQRLYEDMMFLNLFYRNMGSFCWSESENWQFMGAAGLVHHHQLSVECILLLLLLLLLTGCNSQLHTLQSNTGVHF